LKNDYNLVDKDKIVLKMSKIELSRRRFLGCSSLGLTGLTILPSWTLANGVRVAPSDRVTMGFIGLAKQGINDFKSFSRCPGVKIIAGSDVDRLKRERFRMKVEEWQESH
jgi:hypothetical protein